MKQDKQTPCVFDVYDFDHTIYDGDSTVDFYFYSLRRNPKLIGYIPFQLWHGLLFFIRVESKTKFKGNFFIFLRSINTNSYVRDFWAKYFRKIKTWYISQDRSRDIIISASPSFLLSTVTDKLGVFKLISTEVDVKTGKIKGENCYGEEKRKRLITEIADLKLASCYSDSLSDLPILRLAEKAYIVKGDERTLLKLER